MRLRRHDLRPRAVFLALLASASCGGDIAEPGPESVWVVEVSGEEFRVRIRDDSARAGIEQRFQSRERGVVIGSLAAGDGGFNEPWSWHLDPATVQAVDAAIELCDGRPSMVQADLAYWIGTVRTFCPWGARIVRREP